MGSLQVRLAARHLKGRLVRKTCSTCSLVEVEWVVDRSVVDLEDQEVRSHKDSGNPLHR